MILNLRSLFLENSGKILWFDIFVEILENIRNFEKTSVKFRTSFGKIALIV